MVNLLLIPKSLLAFVRWLLAADHLPDLHEDANRSRPRNETFAGWLLSQGELSHDGANGDRNSRASGFLTQILSTEQLPISAPGAAAPEAGRQFTFWRWLFKPESLPSVGENLRRVSSTSGFVRWLVTPDPCPRAAVAKPPTHDRTVSRLIASEKCPEVAPHDSPRRVGVLGWLLSRESCPHVGLATDERRTGFARWLLSQERL